MERERILPKHCFSFAELAVRLTRRSGRHGVLKLVDVMSDVSFDAKEPRQHVKSDEDCERLITESN